MISKNLEEYKMILKNLEEYKTIFTNTRETPRQENINQYKMILVITSDREGNQMRNTNIEKKDKKDENK